jgi:hypothetical protein
MHARSPIVLTTAGVLAAAGLTGCGRIDQDDKPSGARPPVTLQVSAALTDRGVELSPDRVGGGPIRLVISNQSSKAIPVATLKRASGGGTGRATRLPIEQGGVAVIQANVTRGSWRLDVGSGFDAGRLRVAKERQSGDGELLLP